MKTSSEYLKEANAVVKRIDVESGIERHKSGDAVFVDVRDSAEIASTGTIKGSLQIPRGFIEFAAANSINPRGICSCLLYTSPSPRDATLSRMPSSA